MPKYAGYDPVGEPPFPVTGWYDADAFQYPNLPTHRIELTAEQWRGRMTGHWAVQDDTLVSYTKPPPEHQPTAKLDAAPLADDRYQALEKRITELEEKLASQPRTKKT